MKILLMPLKQNRSVVYLLSVLFLILFGPYQATAGEAEHLSGFPDEYGDVIYQYNENRANQLFIIGISHRDTLSRLNSGDTVRSQIEVYRISEWLIRRTGLELLLPEGFFREKDRINPVAVEADRVIKSYSTGMLEEMLENDQVYTNAEMLLMKSMGVTSRQIEDRKLYYSVLDTIRLMEKKSNNMYESLYMKSSLDYLQDKRTAVMLQKIPGVIDNEFNHGRIKEKKAIFTIGMDHIDGIINCLENKQIAIYSPAFSRYSDYVSDLNLLNANFGITVIIPKTLKSVHELMRFTSLKINIKLPIGEI